MKTHNFTFFWGGPFSQWYKSDFTVDSVLYETAEQYMMAKKALLFEDLETHTKIMQSDNPREQKALGRQVRNFNTSVWEGVCKEYVYQANIAKFGQSARLLNELMATGNTEMVEASPHDKIWGIGLSATDERAYSKSTWLGTNWLGEIIQQVREELRK